MTAPASDPSNSKLNPILVGLLFALSIAAITLTFCITPESLSVNLVYQAF
jgi:hypothetical protein